MKTDLKGKILVGITAFSLITTGIINNGTGLSVNADSAENAYSYNINSYVPFNSLDINFNGSVDANDVSIIKNYLLNGETDAEVQEIAQTNAEYISVTLSTIKNTLKDNDILSAVKNITINADKRTDGIYEMSTATITVEFYKSLGDYDEIFDTALFALSPSFNKKANYEWKAYCEENGMDSWSASNEERLKFISESYGDINTLIISCDALMSGEYDATLIAK